MDTREELEQKLKRLKAHYGTILGHGRAERCAKDIEQVERKLKKLSSGCGSDA